MRAVDTNVLVRTITRDDLPQVAAADRYVEKGAWFSLVALAETTWVLASIYSRSPSEVATAVDKLLNHQTLVAQDPEVAVAALKIFRAKPALGFTDCLLLEIARKAGHLPLGTFDRNLSKVEGAEKL